MRFKVTGVDSDILHSQTEAKKKDKKLRRNWLVELPQTVWMHFAFKIDNLLFFYLDLMYGNKIDMVKYGKTIEI